MRHPIHIIYARLPVRHGLVPGSEVDHVVPINILLAKESQVDDDARVGPRPDVAVRERVAVNLDVIGELGGVRDHDLRLGISERNGERIPWVAGFLNVSVEAKSLPKGRDILLLFMCLDLCSEVGIPADIVNQFTLQNNLSIAG